MNERSRGSRQTILTVQTKGKGLHLITDQVQRALAELDPLPDSGMLNCFLQHTSASLLIQENADPTAKADLEEFLNRLIPDGQSWQTHTLEGPDDSTSHLKAAITQTSLMIPIYQGRLALGTWQGIYVWEHRRIAHRRNLLLTVMGI
jgi:secondary thiamine-phosphate synthase enzyme